MTEILFHDGWTLQRSGQQPQEVSLPHDAMVGEQRVPGGGTGRHGAFFPGGRYRYSKRWTAPSDVDQRRVSLFFEGVYGATTVRLDGAEIAANVSGYREFEVVLSGLHADREHLLEVDVDNSSVPNSRWYTGAGIYRPVWLRTLPQQHLDRAGLTVRTASLGSSSAIVEVVAPIVGNGDAELQVTVTLSGAGVVAAESASPVDAGEARLLLDVKSPKLWSHASPYLYTATVTLADASGRLLDQVEQRIGIRTLEVDSRHGLRINRETVLLRGACVHHDNGILGAATFAAAEHRRARILKQNGFNAVRSSHNPLSRAFLDACDELGLYVIDETTDYWRQRKSLHDLSPRFDELWQGDLRSMIEKDRNRPSVIMYAIGNEIPDTATPAGVATAQKLSRYSAALDATRPTTLAVNMMVNLMASRGRDLFENTSGGTDASEEKADASTAANVMADKLGALMNLVSRLPAADKASRDAFAAVDIAGYNYAFGRYAGDRKRYPDRVILGTESMPGDLPKIWRQVERIPGVIGDFMWTGWDYLGEVGIGTWTYGDDKPGLAKQYPHLVAGSGAIDITGVPGAPALLARAVWGELEVPEIAVRPVDHSDEATNKVAWRSSDAIQSWAWTGCEGKRADVEVYSADDEVELFLNGRSLGRKRAGARRGFITRFRTTWQPGELVAVGYRRGREFGRSALRSAGAPRVRLTAERRELTADGHDLAFVTIELADDSGTVDTMASDQVTITLEGHATLAGLGSGAPATEEGFTGATHTTYGGRALAVIRAGLETGAVLVRATTARHGADELQLVIGSVVAPDSLSGSAAIDRGRR